MKFVMVTFMSGSEREGVCTFRMLSFGSLSLCINPDPEQCCSALVVGH